MEIRYNNKKDLLDELYLHKELTLKKINQLDFDSAIKKVKSAIILIEEAQEYFNLDDELDSFLQLNQRINEERSSHREWYLRKYNNLLREDLTEENIDSFLKLLAMLKDEVDGVVNKFSLEDVQYHINSYFEYLKKMYGIISSYKILEFSKASNQILRFAKEIRPETFNNLKALTLSLYRNLVTNKLREISKIQNRCQMDELCEKLTISYDDLIKVLELIEENPQNPIKNINLRSQEIVFK
ncbi:MAG: hypothetical protein KGD73_07685 [Candidatus Lokiarchaeota archaeon]|nr:hypothetical protein [Candidatus Lokiarchaeota archaeon]